ncbi:hypothetical protein ACFQZJ_12920 [Maribacter chungangensis]|uniref:Uncharacterized protein n=1 Tax=Maribacter chungangensis TaxID=1069117 RepID=A0ABW3B4W1_9FLAO
MGTNNYNLPEKLLKRVEEKSARYKLTWMQSNAEQLRAAAIMAGNGI